MDIVLSIMAVLAVALIISTWSSVRSYFERGRQKGIADAVRELARGYELHCEPSKAVIRRARQDLNDLLSRNTALNNAGKEKVHAQLWILGNAIGESCWAGGHLMGVQSKVPAAGFIRVDLSVVDLLQLSHLADRGFHHMMPNFRDFEVQRFSGEIDAIEAATAIDRIEASLPAAHRPDLKLRYADRRRLVRNWWHDKPIVSLASETREFQ